ISAAEATFSLQTNVSELEITKEIDFEISNKSIQMLLFELLEEILYLKDAELFFIKKISLKLETSSKQFTVKGKFSGDTFDIKKYEIGNDLKAITLHNFYVKEINDIWECYVLIDI
ncbi:MAG: archease, partial [Candidatus Heimdallarchaeota archaeon]|nr:archease [Candidatus Heimdallarchaeota archaeon]